MTTRYVGLALWVSNGPKFPELHTFPFAGLNERTVWKDDIDQAFKNAVAPWKNDKYGYFVQHQVWRLYLEANKYERLDNWHWEG